MSVEGRKVVMTVGGKKLEGIVIKEFEISPSPVNYISSEEFDDVNWNVRLIKCRPPRGMRKFT